MDSFFIMLHNSSFSFLLSNIFGLYLPLMISFILILKNAKEIFTKTNIQLFFLGLLAIFLTSDPILTEDFSQLHLTNFVGILYLLYFVFFNKKDLMNIPTVFVLSFFAMWIVDGYYAITMFDSHPFSSAIGGAGLFDGLLIDPLLTSLGVYVVNKLRKNRIEKLLKSAY